MKKVVFILFFYLMFHNRMEAQKLQLKGGIGNYEALNIGLSHSFTKWTLEYGIGSDFNFNQQGFYNVFYISAGKKMLKKIKVLNGNLSLHQKAMVWHIENKSNVFSVFTGSPEIMYRIPLKEKIQLGIYGGIVYSTVFNYKRKNYQDVGFPKIWMPNFGLSLYYHLK